MSVDKVEVNGVEEEINDARLNPSSKTAQMTTPVGLGTDGKLYASETPVKELEEKIYSDIVGNVDIIKFNSTRRSGDTATSSGLTFAFSSPVKCTVTGTTSGTAFANLYSNTSALPTYIQPGKTYHFRVNSNSTRVGLRIYYYKANDSTNHILDTIYDNKVISVPSDAVGMIFRINVSVSSSTSINATVEVGCTEAMTNKELENAVKNRVEVRTFTTAETQTPQDIFDSRIPNAWTGWVSPSWFTQDFNNLVTTAAMIKFGRDTNQSAFLAVGRESLKAVIGAKSEDGTYRVGNLKFTSYSKQFAMFGDSITWGRDGNEASTFQTPYTFTRTIGQNLGIRTFNYGVGSAGYLAKGSDNKNAYEKISSTDIENYDYISLAYGVNDVIPYDVGEWDSTDEETIMGQFNKCINYIYEQNDSCVVIVIAPWNGRNVGTFPEYKLGYSKMIALDTALKTACEYYGIPYISQKDCPINGFNIQTLIGADGVHPSEDGYIKIGNWLSGEIGRLIG